MFGIGELIKVHFTITVRTLRQNKSAKGPRLRQKLTRELVYSESEKGNFVQIEKGGEEKLIE